MEINNFWLLCTNKSNFHKNIAQKIVVVDIERRISNRGVEPCGINFILFHRLL